MADDDWDDWGDGDGNTVAPSAGGGNLAPPQPQDVQAEEWDWAASDGMLALTITPPTPWSSFLASAF